MSSARDLVKLVNAASQRPGHQRVLDAASHEVRVGRSVLAYRNTNLLIGKSDWEILRAEDRVYQRRGRILVMQTMIDERPVTMVLLNSFGKLTRTADARRIRRWMEARGQPMVAGGGEMATK